MQKDTVDQDYILPFGKFKGQSLKSLLSIQPTYLIWMHNKTQIKLTDELYQKAFWNASGDLSDDNPVNEHFSYDIYEHGDN